MESSLVRVVREVVPELGMLLADLLIQLLDGHLRDVLVRDVVRVPVENGPAEKRLTFLLPFIMSYMK